MKKFALGFATGIAAVGTAMLGLVVWADQMDSDFYGHDGYPHNW